MLAALLGVLPILCAQRIGASVLVADTTMSRMVEMHAGAPFCSLYNDRGVIQRMVLGADPRQVRQISGNLVADLEETCKASRDKGKNQASGGLMYPGTKWCGPGDVAESYNDLGQHAAEDACCREHDHCPITMPPYNCTHGICNNSSYTRSHCDCDTTFRKCLQNLNTEVANTVGALYFNVIRITCFKERPPCSKWQSCKMQWMPPTWYESPESKGLPRPWTIFSTIIKDLIAPRWRFKRNTTALS